VWQRAQQGKRSILVTVLKQAFNSR
jgi:hypothetical protein